MTNFLLFAVIGLLATGLVVTAIALYGSRQDQIRAHRSVQEIQAKLKRMEEQRRRSEKKLRRYLQLMDTLINTIPNPIYYKDAAGIYRGCNRAFAREILGLTRDRIIGSHPEDLSEQIPPDLVTLYQRYEAGLTKPGKSVSFEAEVPCSDGQKRDFLFNIAAIENGEKKMSGSVGVMLDLTEKNRAAKSRLQNEKLQGVLETAGAVCHELNQPLQIASGHIEMALLDAPGDPTVANLADKLHGQIERMASITNKLQNITRYETKDYPGNKVIIDIHKASGGEEDPEKRT